MLKNIFNFLLSITFITLVALYAYKVISKPKIVKVPLNISKPHSKNSVAIEREQIHIHSKEEIEEIVKNYIISNPDILITSLENMHKKKESESISKSQIYLKSNKNKIETAGAPPIFGNKDADISIVVFYDYNCSFCKKANIETNKLINFDPGVKIILRPIPILSGTSLYAAKASLALHKVLKKNFQEIHNDMMKLKVINKNSLKEIVKKYNIDFSIVENEINSSTTKKLITNNYNLARLLNISGAPSYIINGIFVPGFIPQDKFKQIILQIRASTESSNDLNK